MKLKHIVKLIVFGLMLIGCVNSCVKELELPDSNNALRDSDGWLMLGFIVACLIVNAACELIPDNE